MNLNKLERLFVAAILALVGEVAWADYQLNIPVGPTETSRVIYDFHMYAIWVCVGIAVVVFGVMFYSIINHRKSRHPVPAKFHENMTLEVVWTVIPVLILIGLAVPSTKALIEIEDTSGAEMDIKITGYQWKWHYEYPQEGIAFFSSLDEASNRARQLDSGIDPRTVPNYLLNVDHPLVVPVNTKIRFLITGADVIHAWWVPAFGWKKDAIPGFVTTAWVEVEKPGVYRGQCAELCGRDHGYMPIVVKAVTKEEYRDWVAEQKQKLAGSQAAAQEWNLQVAMERGREAYNAHCASCHQADGSGVPGTFPALAGSPVATGDVDAMIEIVLEGKGAMPAFGRDENIRNEDLAAVITYVRNAFGNDIGDVVTPEDIADAR
ncbi:cytochrome c oxidase subunit II [Methylomarinovum tepidoasis]|uniref:Cytochrome c oxidase subunit 2 n=1 Tax=Methylomarinovum tepidoasis TaxID=2840183 RepID=A0AAU9CZ73_9GAMM|nr:cytochrome c oxidase subunit II [Methylomarinovum sp. IN45]BCX89324.1 cytochrome c oxidase subunit II [Methylomarinovum sp. IN45]